MRDQRIEDLEQFLAQRGQALLRTAVLLAAAGSCKPTRGRDRTEEPGEQGRSDPVDGTGRL